MRSFVSPALTFLPSYSTWIGPALALTLPENCSLAGEAERARGTATTLLAERLVAHATGGGAGAVRDDPRRGEGVGQHKLNAGPRILAEQRLSVNASIIPRVRSCQVSSTLPDLEHRRRRCPCLYM